MSAAELQGLQDAGRGPARSGSRLGQNEYGRVMEVGASNRQPLRRGTPGEAEPVAPDSGESRELVCISGALRPPIRLSANRLFRSTERVQRSPFDRLDARYHCGGSRRGPGHGAPTRYPYKESCMSNRDGILDSHPSERVKMPPEPTIPTPPSISKPASRSSCSKCSSALPRLHHEHARPAAL